MSQSPSAGAESEKATPWHGPCPQGPLAPLGSETPADTNREVGKHGGAVGTGPWREPPRPSSGPSWVRPAWSDGRRSARAAWPAQGRRCSPEGRSSPRKASGGVRTGDLPCGPLPQASQTQPGGGATLRLHPSHRSGAPFLSPAHQLQPLPAELSQAGPCSALPVLPSQPALWLSTQSPAQPSSPQAIALVAN